MNTKIKSVFQEKSQKGILLLLTSTQGGRKLFLIGQAIQCVCLSISLFMVLIFYYYVSAPFS